jgi:bacillithiol biosynthesis cysteine-adding enzyme BshC
MDYTATRISYQETGHFSGMISEYLAQSDSIQPFYKHPPTSNGIKSSIQARRQAKTNRQLLVDELRKQYATVESKPAVNDNIQKLLNENCFTVTTAHQPAIFTGPLYFIYKILHAVRLSNHLSKTFPDCQFVPVFYMGCEDADLDELGKIYIESQEIVWDTKQTGAVGRMKTKGLEKIIDRIEGEFSVQPYGKELVKLFKESYLNSDNVQMATFHLIHALFAECGLVVLMPDNANLKRMAISLFEDDLFQNKPFSILEQPLEEMGRHHKIQAQPRLINLFYLKDGLRGRIEKLGDKFMVHESRLSFTEAELRKELQQFPERFSPNVILRGIFQEMILPNIIFLGGGGELAYWLEYKCLFEFYQVPYPLLLLRNSFLIIENKWREKLERSGLSVHDVFKPEEDLVNELVKKESGQKLGLEHEIEDANQYYERLKILSISIDPTLSQHIEALQSKAIKPIRELEKKFLKAERRKFAEQQRQIILIRSAMFTLNSLQERIDNFILYYANRGKE